MKDEFLQNELRLGQSETLFRLGTDAMVLADFSRPGPGERVCDLCAGTGAVGLLLLAEDPKLHVTAVELQEDAVQLLRQTAARNGLEDRLVPLRGDLRQIRTLLPQGSFRHVVCNPPYYPVGQGAVARDPALAIARTELCCTLSEVLDAAAWLVPTGGSLWMVHKPERLTDLLLGLRGRDLEPKELRPVAHRAASRPSLILVRAVKGGRPGLELRPTLVLQEEDGSPTPEYRRIYHM